MLVFGYPSSLVKWFGGSQHSSFQCEDLGRIFLKDLWGRAPRIVPWMDITGPELRLSKKNMYI